MLTFATSVYGTYLSWTLAITPRVKGGLVEQEKVTFITQIVAAHDTCVK
jgi:hypothetical protein